MIWKMRGCNKLKALFYTYVNISTCYAVMDRPTTANEMPIHYQPYFNINMSENKTNNAAPASKQSGISFKKRGKKDAGHEHEVISKRNSMHASHGNRPETDLNANTD